MGGLRSRRFRGPALRDLVHESVSKQFAVERSKRMSTERSKRIRTHVSKCNPASGADVCIRSREFVSKGVRAGMEIQAGACDGGKPIIH